MRAFSWKVGSPRPLNSFSGSVIMRRFLFCLLLALAGCADYSTVSAPDRTEAVERDVSFGLETGGTFDEEMAAASDRLPGFAGAYIDSDGALIVRMVRPQPTLDVAREVGDLLARVVLIGPDLASDRASLVEGLRTEPAEYTFRELHRWYRLLLPKVFVLPEATMADIDEVRNRIVFGVQDLREADAIRLIVEEMGVPPEAVVVEEHGFARPAGASNHSLQGTVRPVIGGVQLDAGNPLGVCPLGYNVERVLSGGQWDGERYFVTNSHCTAGGFGVVASPGHGFQPDSTLGSHPIGFEIADPPGVSSSEDPNCPYNPPVRCRYSDASLFEYNWETASNHALIAWPATSESAPFPFTAARNVTGTGDPLAGMTVHKVGRTSGRTSGTVTGTCLLRIQDVTFQPLLCQGRAEYHAGGGDSGSPVVSTIPGNSAHVVERGINWSQGTVNYFSLGREFRRELADAVGGALHTSSLLVAQISGPTEVPPGVGCTFVADIIGGTSPFSYQWSGITSGSSPSAFVVLQNSGWLHLAVTDSGFRSDQTSVWITVDSSAPTPPECTE